MSEISLQDRSEYLRAVQARMMRQSLAHQLKTIDARTAIICAKSGLFQSRLESPLPQDVLRVVENPKHEQRLPGHGGPFFVFRKGAREAGMIEVALLILDPELRVRRAAVAELDRQIPRYRPLLTPQTRVRFDGLRGPLLSDNEQESLGAAVELHDCLRSDYFYQTAALRQCAGLRMDEEVRTILHSLLTPDEATMQFLAGLPVWSAERQDADIRALRRDLLQSATSLQDLLSRYFRLFGHLPLVGNVSAAGVVEGWREKQRDPKDPWQIVWTWAKDNGSPLASYHACQVLCHTAAWVGDQHRQILLSRVADVIRGPSAQARWKRRCDLARHYCRHLETLTPGADGERVAAFAWWFAEMLGAAIDEFPEPMLQIAPEIVGKAFAASEEVWTVARPFATLSSLRYATLFSGSIWSTAMMCELAESPLAAFADTHEGIRGALAIDCAKPAYCPENSAGKDQTIWYAFQGSYGARCARTAAVADAKTAPSLQTTRSVVTTSCDGPGLGTMVRQLASYDASVAITIAHRIRQSAFCGATPCADLWDAFVDGGWREQVLAHGGQECVELLCTAAIQLQAADPQHEWRSYLPHFLALTCEDTAANPDRKRILFAYTIVASVAVDSVSAVERLLTGAHRREYQDFVQKWRERIERLTPFAPAWIAARLRSMKAALYID